MSFSPALLANRRWVAGGSFYDQAMGPSKASVVTAAVATRANGASGNLVTAFPAGMQVGDLLVVMGAGGGANPTVPTGWTQAAAYNSGGYSAYIFSKTVTAADISAGSVSLAIAGTSAQKAMCFIVPGVGWKVQTGSQAQGTSTQFASGITVSPQGGLLIGVGNTGVAQPGGYTQVGGGSFTYIQDLSSPYSTVFGIGDVTSANVQFSGSYATNSIYTFVSANIIQMGLPIWTPQYTVPTWMEVRASAPYDTFQLDYFMDIINGTPVFSRAIFDVGVGPAGSEVSLYTGQFETQQIGTAGQSSYFSIPVSVPLAIKQGQRVAVRGAVKGFSGDSAVLTAVPNVHFAFAGV